MNIILVFIDGTKNDTAVNEYEPILNQINPFLSNNQVLLYDGVRVSQENTPINLSVVDGDMFDVMGE